MTDNEIVSGTSNQIFDDISDVDRATGDASVRKVYAAVTSADTAKYLDAGVLVFSEPDDDAVSVLAASTGSYYDERADIQAYIENYLVRGARYGGFLYETQIAGARSITFFGREEDEAPAINSTLVLVEFTDEDHETESYSQYVRIIRILLNDVQTFTTDEGEGTFQRRVITVELSEALRYTFHGAPMSRYDNITPLAMIYSTAVADAARYYGIRPTTALAETGDYSVTVDSIYGQLVPSSQTETPSVDLSVAANRLFAYPATTGTVSLTVGDTFSPDFTLYIGQALYPGSLSITVTGGTLTDSGGQLLSGTTVIGTVDYTSGLVVFGATSPTYSGSKTVTFRPSAPLSRISNSFGIPVAVTNRYRTYVATLNPIPNPGSLIVDYLSQGNWYRLQDQGNGILQGTSESYGAGTLNYLTGSVSLTLGAYPDINSTVLFFYGSGVDASDHAEEDKALTIQLSTLVGLTTGSIALAWGGNTLTDQGDGTMTGTGGSATIDYGTGTISWIPDTIPASGTTLTVTGTRAPTLNWNTQSVLPTMDGSGVLTIPIGTDAIEGTIHVQFTAQVLASELTEPDSPSLVTRLELAQANGSGGWIGRSGTINVAGGTMTLDSNVTFEEITVPYYEEILTTVWVWDEINSVWAQQTITDKRLTGLGLIEDVAGRWQSGTNVNLGYSSTASTTNVSLTLTLSSLVFSVQPTTLEPLVSNSLRFTMGSRTYQDADGVMVYGKNPTTGLGTTAGAVDLQTGVVTLSDWPATTNSIDIKALAGRIERTPVVRAVFRAPVSPVVPESFTFRCTAWIDESLVEGTADENGVIEATSGTVTVAGRLDYQTGVGEIYFDVPVDLSTLLYDCVSYTTLPVDSSIIGLDPVRLPGDGRVPIFRDGQLVLVHHTDTHTENSLSPTQQVDMGRVRLYRVVIEDDDEKRLPASFYSVDRETGIVTMAADLNLTGYSGPYVFYHTIADLSLISDADLSGQLNLTRPLSHDFPADDSRVSGVLYVGTLQARYANLFSQATWTSVWSDTVIGDPPLAQYNDVTYPLTVSNLGAYQDRFVLRFTSSSAFGCYGENLGYLGAGNINEDFAPTNLLTGQPYFTIDYRGWGGGWSTGNCLRFNLIGANYPVDLIRSVQPSAPSGSEDSVELLFVGNVDA